MKLYSKKPLFIVLKKEGFEIESWGDKTYASKGDVDILLKVDKDYVIVPDITKKLDKLYDYELRKG